MTNNIHGTLTVTETYQKNVYILFSCGPVAPKLGSKKRTGENMWSDTKVDETLRHQTSGHLICQT